MTETMSHCDVCGDEVTPDTARVFYHRGYRYAAILVGSTVGTVTYYFCQQCFTFVSEMLKELKQMGGKHD